MTRKYLDELGGGETRGHSSVVSIISEEATAYLRDPSVVTIKNKYEGKKAAVKLLNESSIDKTSTTYDK